jgi:4-hydroxy-2-oxoheptanedioate aldolase
MSGSTTAEYFEQANANTLVCLMLEEVVALRNIREIASVKGVDVLFIGSGDLSQSMGYPGQQSHPEVLAVMEEGVKAIREAGVVAGVSCPDALIPKFLGLGVQYFHSNVASLLQSAGQSYLKTARQAAESSR